MCKLCCSPCHRLKTSPAHDPVRPYEVANARAAMDEIMARDAVSVRVTANAAQGQMWDMAMDNDVMRDQMLVEGPFGYPLMMMQNATMLGTYHADVSGTDEASTALFLENIIGCAIDNGVLANGVDPATLTR